MTRNQVVLGIISLLLLSTVGLFAFNSVSARAYAIGQASGIVERYLASLNAPDLATGELMEFTENFYVIVYERSTGLGAFEMLIDKTSGRIFPEYGPNMMWNLKYGHGGMMGGWSQPPSGSMPVDKETALTNAQVFLDGAYPGTTADDAHVFYGYYTLHVIRDGAIYGMLSVNGYDGAVWYHNWHGTYIQSNEAH